MGNSKVRGKIPYKALKGSRTFKKKVGEEKKECLDFQGVSLKPKRGRRTPEAGQKRKK